MYSKKNHILIAVLSLLLACTGGDDQMKDVLPEYHNKEVTALTHDSETTRMALGAAWDNLLDARSFNGYLDSWQGKAEDAGEDALVKEGMALFELMYSVDHGIQSVRLARDSREARRLPEDIRFWRNELALAARKVSDYAESTRELKEKLASRLREQAGERGITTEEIQPIPWEDESREAWRKAGTSIGVRHQVIPHPGGQVDWWYKNLSIRPGYMVSKLRNAGDHFNLPERPIGNWGYSCTGPGQYDWDSLNLYVRLIKERQATMRLELTTLQEFTPPGERNLAPHHNNYQLDLYAPVLPPHLDSLPGSYLVTRREDGSLQPYGGVQLFNPEIAQGYGDFLMAMAENLKQQGLYEAIESIHLGNPNINDLGLMGEEIDFSSFTRGKWQDFMKSKYGNIADLNQLAGTDYTSFEDIPLPERKLIPEARDEWQAFKATGEDADEDDWSKFLLEKYGSEAAVHKALGRNLIVNRGHRAYQESIPAVFQLPFAYPQVIGIDYLHFRRKWIQDYLDIKEDLARKAFPGKLVIREMWQFGDHDAVIGRDEEKWSGFLGPTNDIAQWTSSGPHNETLPFMSRSIGPVGFGSRVSDAVENIFRDYLRILFTNPGNLTRYFYNYVAQGYFDFQLGWHAITNHWLTNQLIYGFGPTLANTQPSPQRIGMLFPRATYDLHEGFIYYDYLGWDWMLHAAKLPYTRVDEDLIREGWLKESGLEVLILPDVRAMDSRVAAALEQWVSGGGTLITSRIPGFKDNYGRKHPEPVLNHVLGVSRQGTVSQGIRNTPLDITIPRGYHSGGWYDSTNRTPQFQVLQANSDQAEVLARYEGGRNAITRNSYGRGTAITMGYPFGYESVLADRTTIGFGRIYTWFVREPQLVARTGWLREFFTKTLGYQPDYGVEYAEVGRFKGRDAIATHLSAPKGFSQEPGHYSYVRTVGDPRPGHELIVEHEQDDMALRFFPRHRDGLDTRYLGISTRDVHYMSPRGNVNMFLAKHNYRCRINNPAIQVIWDIQRDVPVGFERDERGVSFTISLPSGHVTTLAVSEKKKVELFPQDPFPGRKNEAVVAECRKLAGGSRPEPVEILTPDQIQPWLEAFAKSNTAGEAGEVLISYGQPANKAAAEELAAYLSQQLNIPADITREAAEVYDEPEPGTHIEHKFDLIHNRPRGHEHVDIFIGNEWTNNDMALHAAYWSLAFKGHGVYSPHLPFTASHAWPGEGRAVVSLSRPFAMVNEEGWNSNSYIGKDYRIRPVEKDFLLSRRKLYIAGDGDDAEAAGEAVIDLLQKKEHE